MKDKREIYFHEDDYCQQQLLPREAAGYVAAELIAINDFANTHAAPDGMGWTDMYMRNSAPVEFRSLNLRKEDLGRIVTKYLPPYDIVYTGYGSHQEVCQRTAAWGKSAQCSLFADWGEDGMIANVWAELFDTEGSAVSAATKAVAAIGMVHQLIYVDWAWGYSCEVLDEENFAFLLRSKLESIGKKL